MSSSVVIPLSQVPRHFQDLGLTYLGRPLMDYEPHQALDWTAEAYYRDNIKEFQLSEKRYGAQIRGSYIAPVSLRFISADVGWGVFAEKDLKPGDLIGEYTGRIQLAREIFYEGRDMPTWESDYAWNYPCELPDGTELEINALKEGNVLRFVNHSFQPNGLVDHTLIEGYWSTFFTVKKSIPQGTQIMVDYGEEYWIDEHRTLVIL